jgi:hypothetical protein
MTSPQIILTLHGAGEKYCERCEQLRSEHVWVCVPFEWSFGAPIKRNELLRLPACLASETELNRLKVETDETN